MPQGDIIYIYQAEGRDGKYFALYKEEKEISFESFDDFTNSIIHNFTAGYGIRYDIPPNLSHLENNNRSLQRRKPLNQKTEKELEKRIQESFNMF